VKISDDIRIIFSPDDNQTDPPPEECQPGFILVGDNWEPVRCTSDWRTCPPGIEADWCADEDERGDFDCGDEGMENDSRCIHGKPDPCYLHPFDPNYATKKPIEPCDENTPPGQLCRDEGDPDTCDPGYVDRGFGCEPVDPEPEPDPPIEDIPDVPEEPEPEPDELDEPDDNGDNDNGDNGESNDSDNSNEGSDTDTG
jgi:hypothetical protein